MTECTQTPCKEKKLNQRRISEYFVGCVKRIPVDTLIKKRRSRRKMSFSSSSSIFDSPKVHRRDFLFDESFNSLLETIPKRKLPAPIFSDDEEDSEQTDANANAVKEPKVSLSLNKPKRIDLPKKPKPLRTSTPIPSTSCDNNVPLQTDISLQNSTAKSDNITVVEKPQNSDNASTNSSKSITENETSKSTNCASPSKVRVLESVIISPKKSPTKKPLVDKENIVKNEKKLNYEQLKVLREFFINVLKKDHLNKLVDKSDMEMLSKFFGMERDYQFLCVKLFMYKPSWYNVFKYVTQIGLSMSETQVSQMYKHLEENNFIDTHYLSQDTFTLLNLLGVKELREIVTYFKMHKTGMTKDLIISTLMKNCKTQITLFAKNTEELVREQIKKKMGYAMKLSDDLQRCLQYIFILNTYTNESIMCPQDYFKNVQYLQMVFPDYKVENFNVFYTPQEFQKYASAVILHSDLERAIEKKNTIQIFNVCKTAFQLLQELNTEFGTSFDTSRKPHLEKFTANAQYIRTLTSGSKHITTTYYNEIKIWFEYLLSQGYCKYKRGDWYCQLSLIYTVYLKAYEVAAKLLVKAFHEEKEHFCDVQLQELAHRARILFRKTYKLPQLLHDQIASLLPPSCDRDWPQEVMDCKSMQWQELGQKRKYVARSENGDVTYLGVEQLALQHYRSLDFPNGVHCEGTFIVAVFCLLFWDIIYDTYVEGTFVSRVQNAPLDMYSEYFYINRETCIKKRIKKICDTWTDAELQRRLFQNWNLHSHETSLCLIESFSEGPKYVIEIITCIGRRVLSKIFDRLVKNFRIYHSGFPDLIVWNPELRKAKFVEVKSENDKLSIKQKLWLNYLIEIGASAEVCHVEPKASKKKFNNKTQKS